MNINDFLLTVSISLTAGIAVGYLARDFFAMLKRLHAKYIKRSQYFEDDKSL
ncbi:hypothetical protein [Psychromonas aquimarina]|uniref:hypothetical protein n=1 Tax=Psychromonas aquimarina TaxID=444919 RepID=UPI00040D31B4|nr:hypothetical protein [Psychromonas aquimarina]